MLSQRSQSSILSTLDSVNRVISKDKTWRKLAAAPYDQMKSTLPHCLQKGGDMGRAVRGTRRPGLDVGWLFRKHGGSAPLTRRPRRVSNLLPLGGGRRTSVGQSVSLSSSRLFLLGFPAGESVAGVAGRRRALGPGRGIARAPPAIPGAGVAGAGAVAVMMRA
jgi:hypothetical protein